MPSHTRKPQVEHPADDTSSTESITLASRRQFVLGALAAGGGAACLPGCAIEPDDLGGLQASLTNSAADALEAIGALRAETPNGAGDPECFVVLGYHVAGDGGGGFFYRDPASTAVDRRR